jgi:hypothetical protein
MALRDNNQAAEYMKGTGHLEYLLTPKDLMKAHRFNSQLFSKLHSLIKKRRYSAFSFQFYSELRSLFHLGHDHIKS